MTPITTVAQRSHAAGNRRSDSPRRSRLARSQTELLTLYHAPLEEIEKKADTLRKEINGEIVTYNINRHIEPTNICHLGCTFCSFARNELGSPGAFRFTVEEILERTIGDEERGITEYHIVGGVDPALNLDYYTKLISSLKKNHPKITVKSLSAVEIGALAKRHRLSFRDTLERLKAAGAEGITGGGAEIFAPRVRRRIAGTKITGEEWLEIHRQAHRLGLFSTATMLFGHIETPEERIDHLLALRELQNETGGFRCFVPLPFVPSPGTPMAGCKPPSAVEYLRTVALSRIALDNFPVIKAYWPAAGVGVAQLALHFGAADLDGTVTEETIYETNQSPLTRFEIEELIRQAGRIPRKRR